MHKLTVPMHLLILKVWSNLCSPLYLEILTLRHERNVIMAQLRTLGMSIYQ